MRKLITITALLSALTIFALSSCFSGLEPAWKHSAVLQLDFSQSGDGSRAIGAGTGYLYIRTIGGPEGKNGPLYGPFTVDSTGVFATSAIPAGTYSKFCICYSLIPLVNNAAFMSLVSLSDAAFLEQATDGFTMNTILDGNASGVILDNVTLQDGVVNPISAVLVPFIDEELAYYMLNLGGSYTNMEMTLPDVGSSVHKKFVRIANVYENLENYVITCSFNGNAFELPVVRLYDSSGRLLASRTNSSGATEYVSFEFPYTGGADFYLYIEYSNAPLLFFEVSGAPV